MSYYSSWHWKKLSRLVKRRDNLQCQVCGDRQCNPYCVLHAHHIIPRPQGRDLPENVITLCDLCHAVVTPRWHRPWFGNLAPEQKRTLEDARQEFMEFLALNPNARTHRQALLWSTFGITNTGAPILGN
jgi:5-methylcytosine-specific restriction endonuclease McrA